MPSFHVTFALLFGQWNQVEETNRVRVGTRCGSKLSLGRCKVCFRLLNPFLRKRIHGASKSTFPRSKASRIRGSPSRYL